MNEQYLVTDMELTVRRYFGGLKDRVSFQILENDWTAMYLPYVDYRGEPFVLYIRAMGRDAYVITDNGRSMDAVGESGSLFPESDVETMVSAVACANRIECESRQLWVDTDGTDLGDTVGCMIRVMIFADGLCLI